MTTETPKPGNDTGLPRVKITRRGGVNYITLVEPPKRRAKPAKGGTDAESLRAMFPYLVIPRPGVYQVRIAGRMVGKITAQPGTDAFGKEYASIIKTTRQGVGRGDKAPQTAGRGGKAPQAPADHLPLDVLCTLSNGLGEKMGAYVDSINNGPETRDLHPDERWNPERMAELRKMQKQYSELQRQIMRHPLAHTLETTERTVGARRAKA